MDDDNYELVKILVDLGIPANEARTYVALVPYRTASIRKIASLTGINRGTTYEALKNLTTYGLVSVKRTGDKREQYTAESPDRVHAIIREKRRDLVDIAATAKELIPRILATKATPSGVPLVRYYEGDDGLVSILKDVLQTCNQLDTPEYYAYSSSIVRQHLYRGYPHFTDRRIADGIRVFVIRVGSHDSNPAALSERKFLADSDHNEHSSYMIIYGNKVAIMSVTSALTPYGVVIEDEGTATMQRLLFKQLWKML